MAPVVPTTMTKEQNVLASVLYSLNFASEMSISSSASLGEVEQGCRNLQQLLEHRFGRRVGRSTEPSRHLG